MCVCGACAASSSRTYTCYMHIHAMSCTRRARSGTEHTSSQRWSRPKLLIVTAMHTSVFSGSGNVRVQVGWLVWLGWPGKSAEREARMFADDAGRPGRLAIAPTALGGGVQQANRSSSAPSALLSRDKASEIGSAGTISEGGCRPLGLELRDLTRS